MEEEKEWVSKWVDLIMKIQKIFFLQIFIIIDFSSLIWAGKLKPSSELCVFWNSRVSTKHMRAPCMPKMRSVDPTLSE